MVGVWLVLRLCVAVMSASGSISYPEVRRDENVVDDYFGTKIKDPYRWLEDLDSKETKKFIEEQNKISRSYLDSGYAQHEINVRLNELYNTTEYSSPVKSGGKYFYLKTSTLLLENQPAVYVQDDINGQPRLFLDVNDLKNDSTVAISDFVLSEDGSTVAYALSEGGTDWLTIHFKDVKTGKDYPEELKDVRLSTMTWTPDNKGIFYNQYPTQSAQTEEPKDQKLYYHRLNTSQSEDVLTAEFPDQPLGQMESVISHDGRYLVLLVRLGPINNKVYYADLGEQPDIMEKLQLRPVVDKLDAVYQYITNDGSVCVFLTNKNAPNYKLIKIDLNDPSEKNWKTLVPEQADALNTARVADEDKLVLEYLRDVKSVLQLHDLKTSELLHTFDLPIGTLEQIFAKKSESECFLSFTSFLIPKTIYHVDLKNKPYKTKVFLEQTVKGFDSSDFEAKQIFYSSNDGTKVPMFIVSKKNLPKNGTNPTLLYGNGGFGNIQMPRYSETRLVFMQHFNGIIAVANIRGGGEYGESWHKDGSLLNKQNSFEDFQAAALYLIKEKYTAPSYIAIQGGYHGGSLVAACVNQRPDLYATALVTVGLLDMLRYHRFTVGFSWASEYGTSDNETEFRNLFKYSPLHNINMQNNREYPATLLLTGDDNKRVAPLHTFKFTAALQHEARRVNQRRPLLASIETKADYGLGTPTKKSVAVPTDMLSFIAQSMGLKYTK